MEYSGCVSTENRQEEYRVIILKLSIHVFLKQETEVSASAARAASFLFVVCRVWN